MMRAFCKFPSSVATVLKAVTIYLVRHGKAGDRSAWKGDDIDRPLSHKGQQQALAICERLEPLISMHADAKLISSPFLRCLQTLEPLGEGLGRAIISDDRLAEGYEREGALKLISSLPHASVLCSHGDVIPDVMAALQRRQAAIIGQPDWRKGVVWVLTRQAGEITHAEAWPPPDND